MGHHKPWPEEENPQPIVKMGEPCVSSWLYLQEQSNFRKRVIIQTTKGWKKDPHEDSMNLIGKFSTRLSKATWNHNHSSSRPRGIQIRPLDLQDALLVPPAHERRRGHSTTA